MLQAMILSMIFLGAEDALAPRLDTLAFFVERLEAIQVPAELQTEKDARLAEVRTKLTNGAKNDAEFTALYEAIDDARMWLWQHAAERPALPQGQFEDKEDAWIVGTPSLTLHIAKADLVMEVKTPAETWRFLPSDKFDIEFQGKSFALTSAKSVRGESFNTGYSVGLLLTFLDFQDMPGFELRLTANLIGNEAVFELAAHDVDTPLQYIRWPKDVETGNTESDLSVIPRMQGMLIPGNWPEAIEAMDLCNSRAFYMPWWGQVRNGHGIQTILETSADAGGRYRHPAGGPTVIGPVWYASLGRLGYLRTIRYVFDDESSYVRMAKRFRRFVQERGDFVSLKEKLTRTPSLDEVIGKPVVHMGAMYHFVREAQLYNKERVENNHTLQTFDQLAGGLRQLKAAGIEHAYVHLDGWGFYGYDNGHPDPLPVGQEQGGWEGLKRFADTCQELGYLFATHDQYRDFYLNAASYDKRLVLTKMDGTHDEYSVWCGGPQTFLNPRFAPEYVRRNHDAFAAHGIKVRGAYLDVFSVVPLEESAQAAHPITRAECAEYRRDCFDVLRARGYVVSSEEPSDYLVKSLDLVHHGPYSTSPNIGGGIATGIPVPLFNLVYHDSLLEPWDMGDDGGWGIPNGDAGRLHCVLNAGLPYVGPGAGAEHIERVKEAAALARRCGMLEMVNHEFLDASWRQQRTTYSDGTAVTVNFQTKEYTISNGSGS